MRVWYTQVPRGYHGIGREKGKEEEEEVEGREERRGKEEEVEGRGREREEG